MLPLGATLQVRLRLDFEPLRQLRGVPLSNPGLVPCRRRARLGSIRHYRAALCTELKQPLAIEEVAPRPVRPHEVGGLVYPPDLLTPFHFLLGHHHAHSADSILD